DLNTLLRIKSKYIGKKGIVTELIRSLSSLPKEERPAAGRAYNELKKIISDELNQKERELKLTLKAGKYREKLDVTVPGFFIPMGRRHPVSIVLDEVREIFVSMGFSVKEGPEVELDYYNFEALNIPRDHPARDMQDTFYISEGVLLRTHTSAVQIRVMEKHQPPLKVIATGKVYRHDADISHTPMFHQVEGFLVDRGVSMANLKALLEAFIHTMFGKETPVRFRPSYFPFTEPSAEVDIGCVICGGRGCGVCKRTGWIEILGCGLIHPKVFKNVGYDTSIYSGLAFGVGIERLTMLKYGIDDIRLFFENDMRFLEQF
ncbi:MAG: phenylalanine--tRNA ligase subunit alpha, partial [Nitrospirae bacterium]